MRIKEYIEYFKISRKIVGVQIYLVSAYFPVKIHKIHSSHEYMIWGRHLFDHIAVPMFLFTNSHGKRLFNKTVPLLRYMLKYENVLDVEWIKSYDQIYKEMEKKDPEICRHSYEKYLVWNSKFVFLKEISDMYPNAYVYWLDIGITRKFKYIPKNFLFPNAMKLFKSSASNEMLFAVNALSASRKIPVIDNYIYPTNIVVGGFFGGDHEAVKKFFESIDEYRKMHDKFFIGKEQDLLNTYFIYHNKSRCLLQYPKEGIMWGEWMIFLSYFGTPSYAKLGPKYKIVESLELLSQEKADRDSTIALFNKSVGWCSR